MHVDENKTKTNDLNKVKIYGVELKRRRKVIVQKPKQQNRKLEIVVIISNFTHLSLAFCHLLKLSNLEHVTLAK